MAYKPSMQGPTEGEPFESARRVAEASRSALADADIIGLPEDEARRRVEAAGLHFRPVGAGDVMTADLSLTRVTATIVDDRVHEARVG
ncbi:MAG: hypothetical protein WD794_02010 [Mycobacteriales bacterium]